MNAEISFCFGVFCRLKPYFLTEYGVVIAKKTSNRYEG